MTKRPTGSTWLFFLFTQCWLTTSASWAQNPPPNLTGTWSGTLSSFSRPHSKTSQLILTLEQDGSQIRGTTKLIAGNRSAVFALSGQVVGDVLTLLEGSILEKSPRTKTKRLCLSRDMRLTLTHSQQLDGLAKSPTRGCYPGRVMLTRQDQPTTSPIEAYPSLLSGQVLDKQTTAPIQAIISIVGEHTPKQTISTSKAGDYSLTLTSKESYIFVITAEGYETARVEWKPDKAVRNFFLASEKSVDTMSAPAAPLDSVAMPFNQPIALNTVLFGMAKSDLLPSSYAELNKVAALMAASPSVQIRLEGHTDKRGDSVKNKELSQSRVEAVKTYLVSQGITNTRIATASYGDTRPICQPGCPANRRVEFVITHR